MTVKMILFSSVLLFIVFNVSEGFDVPEATFEVFRPRGFKVSIPDVDGIKLFAFHAKLNEEMNGREGGTFSRDITKAKNGRWTFYDPYTVLNVGDVLYYWTYVDYFDGRNKLGYTNDDRSVQITNELIVQNPNVSKPPPVTPSTSTTTQRTTHCGNSITRFNGGQKACSGQSIFSDTLDPSKWRPELRFAGPPDYEFVVYTDKSDNLNFGNGRITIKPMLSNTLFGGDFVTSSEEYNMGPSCTGKTGTTECTQRAEAYIIKPPVASAQITTKDTFSFLYGKIEIKAKLPKGDWIYPELYLSPKNEEYGEHYQSGQIRIAFLPGNTQMSKVLYGGCILGRSNEGRSHAMKSIRRTNSWADDFHRFTAEWTDKKITLSVDDNVYGHIYPPAGGFAELERQLDLQGGARWRSSPSEIAPFDKEMYITIGVGVGGWNFPDRSDGSKPWSNDDPKMQKNFYRAKNKWFSTWGSESALQVEYVKVNAI